MMRVRIRRRSTRCLLWLLVRLGRLGIGPGLQRLELMDGLAEPLCTLASIAGSRLVGLVTTRRVALVEQHLRQLDLLFRLVKASLQRCLATRGRCACVGTHWDTVV